MSPISRLFVLTWAVCGSYAAQRLWPGVVITLLGGALDMVIVYADQRTK